MDFSNKVSLVTGGTRGIGKSIVASLLNQGSRVIFTGTKEKGNVQVPKGSHYFPLNFNDDKSIYDFLNTINSDFKRIDVLVNNAGINIISEIDQIDVADLRSVLNVNLIGPALITSSIAKKMKVNQYGRIINISSIYGLGSRSGRVSYSSSKFGLIGQTKAVALDLAKSGILVNSICPGFVETDLTEKILGKSGMEKLKAKIPLGRLATPDDISSSVLFLSSDLNTYITGQTLVVDGGYLIE